MKMFTKFRSNYLMYPMALAMTFLFSGGVTFAQSYKDYVMLSGDGGPGTTNPGGDGYGVIFGGNTIINGGNVGSYVLVKSTSGATVSANINSRGRVILSN